MTTIIRSRYVSSFDIVRDAAICLWLVIITLTPYGLYAIIPQEFQTPADPLTQGWKAIGALGYEGWFLGMKFLAIACCVAALAWRDTHIWTVLAFLSVASLDGTTKALMAWPNHAQIVPLIVFGIAAALPRLDARSPSPRTPSPSRAAVALWLTKLTIVLLYSYIGTYRLLFGGVEAFTGPMMEDYLVRNSMQDSQYGFTMALSYLGTPLFVTSFKVGFVIVTVVEALSPLVFFSRRFLWLWIVTLTMFHFLSLVTLNIFFWENMLLMYAAFAVQLEPEPPGLSEQPVILRS